MVGKKMKTMKKVLMMLSLFVVSGISQIAFAETKPFTHVGVQKGKSFRVCPLARTCETLKVQSFKRVSSSHKSTMLEMVVKSSHRKHPYKMAVQCSIALPMVRIGSTEFEAVPLNEDMAPSASKIEVTEVYLKACHNKGFEDYDKVVKKYGYYSYE